MLNELTRKLCPFLTVAMATVGCGKKIGDSGTTLARSMEYQELPSTYILELDGINGQSIKNYKMPQNGNFTLPERLKVTGNALNKEVLITYDLDSEDSDNYQFKCFYLATSASDMKLQRCVDWYGGDFGNVSGVVFGLRKNNIIQLRFLGEDATDLKVEAIYQIQWK